MEARAAMVAVMMACGSSSSHLQVSSTVGFLPGPFRLHKSQVPKATEAADYTGDDDGR